MPAASPSFTPGSTRPPARPVRSRFRRVLNGLLALGAVSTVVFVLLTWRLFISPAPSIPDRADVVVVMAGGQGERLETALELMNDGIAPVLALSMGGDEWTDPPEVPVAVRSMCNKPGLSYEVVCLWADPDSTVGEASAWSIEAIARGWKRLVVVTSDSHLTRSMRWFERCFPGAVYGAPAPETIRPYLLVHEWGGVLAQMSIHRECTGSGRLEDTRRK